MSAPESFTSAERLKIDSIRSPTMAANPVQSPVNKEPPKLFPKAEGNNSKASQPAAVAAISPPIKPTMLLFGLAGTKPRFPFPNNIPKSHASESHKKTISKNIAMIFEADGQRVITEINDKKSPG